VARLSCRAVAAAGEEQTVSLWVIDDAQEIRDGVSAALGRMCADIRVSGRFGLGREALRALARGDSFDVALVDLGLPDMAGDALIGQMRGRCPRRSIVAFTVRSDDGAVFSALRAGASGFVTKELPAAELARAITAAAAGAAPFSPDVSGRVAASFWAPDAGSGATGGDVPLTSRERDVLDLLCTGASYREVAEGLGIGVGTVQTYVKSVYAKLGVSTKAEAIRHSYAAGWLAT
jgi:DNA-binding NarL/FixJ family response regulator